MLLVPSVSLAAQRPDTVSAADLVVAGISMQTDTDAVRRKLGSPTNIERPDSTGPYREFVIWSYPSLKVTFDSGVCDAVEILDSSISTKRGARVGDPRARITRLYGTPEKAAETAMLYMLSRGPSELRGVFFVLESGKVTSIIIGNVLLPD